jgi:DNA-directed RNA polymerase subunit RPC12/RpoP
VNCVLIYKCQDCGREVLLHQGSPINISFARLPEAVAKAMNHKCKGSK